MGLQQFEERLERLVEGTLAKPFRSNLQPVEIGRRLTREMDLHRRVGVRGLIAPNAFAVTLSAADVSRFANFIDALSRELSDAAREHARVEGYAFVGPVEVEIFEGSNLKAGRFTVDRRGAARVRTAASWPKWSCPTGGGSRWVRRPWSSAASRSATSFWRTPTSAGAMPSCGGKDDGVFVTDLGSTNGTRVNGSPVREQLLASGDEISVGSTKLIFEMS